jgi:hypothetical protein
MELRVAKETRNSGRPCGCLRLSRTYDGSGDHQFSVLLRQHAKVSRRPTSSLPFRVHAAWPKSFQNPAALHLHYPVGHRPLPAPVHFRYSVPVDFQYSVIFDCRFSDLWYTAAHTTYNMSTKPRPISGGALGSRGASRGAAPGTRSALYTAKHPGAVPTAGARRSHAKDRAKKKRNLRLCSAGNARPAVAASPPRRRSSAQKPIRFASFSTPSPSTTSATPSPRPRRSSRREAATASRRQPRRLDR